MWDEISPLNPVEEKPRSFTASWCCHSQFRVTYSCGSLSTSFYYRHLVLLAFVRCVCMVLCEGPMLSIFTSASWLLRFPWPVCYWEVCLDGAYSPWWALIDSWSGRLTSVQIQFSHFISASWVQFCSSEAGVIYWVNLHFSDVATAMVMSESQLRWTAVLLVLTPWHLPTWLKLPWGPYAVYMVCGKGSGLWAFLSGIITS